MKKNVKKVILLVIGLIIGASTIVGATTIFRSEDITYSSPTNKINVKDSLDELYSKVGKCPDGWHCYTDAISISDKVEIGDYISMTPTSTSYTISKDLTGYETDQTINPSELNLWRVIKKNEDGTVDVISEHTSSSFVNLRGHLGFMNFVGMLNTVASQYTNSKYVQSTRYVGYEGQEEYCKSSSMTDCPTPVWTTMEEFTSAEIQDVKLIMDSIGTLQASYNGGSPETYWMSKRSRWYDEGNLFVYKVERSGALNNYSLVEDGEERTWSSVLRPILTLKATVETTSGDGKRAETAYTFE